MKYKKLGTTDIDVSLICLGTMTWGTQNNQDEAFAQMNFAFEKGVNFFDTAELYSVPPNSESYGKTETMIGNWFKTNKNRKTIDSTRYSQIKKGDIIKTISHTNQQHDPKRYPKTNRKRTSQCLCPRGQQ